MRQLPMATPAGRADAIPWPLTRAHETLGPASRLVRDRLLTEARPRSDRRGQARRQPFVQYLVEQKMLDSRRIAMPPARSSASPCWTWLPSTPVDLPLNLVDERLIRKHRALPIYRRGNRLFVALSDPTNDQALDEIRFNTGLTTEAVLVEEDKLAVAIEQAIDAQDTTMMDHHGHGSGQSGQAADEERPDETRRNSTLTRPRWCATSTRSWWMPSPAVPPTSTSSPTRKTFRIRFRQDGMLHEVANPPVNIVAPPGGASQGHVAHEYRRAARTPGRAHQAQAQPHPGYRLSRQHLADPLRGEGGAAYPGDRLHPGRHRATGFRARSSENAFLAAIGKPYGMILVTGPTGSGKTVTLYTRDSTSSTSRRSTSPRSRTRWRSR